MITLGEYKNLLELPNNYKLFHREMIRYNYRIGEKQTTFGIMRNPSAYKNMKIK